MKVRTIKDLLQDLANLNPKKQTYAVCKEYVSIVIDEKCPECNGKGVFTHGGYEYVCKRCNGDKKLINRKLMYVVKRVCTHGYPDIDIRCNYMEIFNVYSLQGLFNTKKDAQKLADELNRED